MSRMLLRALVLSLISGPRAGTGQPSDWPEAVAPVIRWSSGVVAKDVQVVGGSVFVEGKGSLVVLDGDSGRHLWVQPLGNQASPRLADPMLVMDGTVAVAVGHRVLMLNSRTGEIVAEAKIPGGSVRLMAGPPLVIETERHLTGSVILRLDNETGKTLATRRSNFVDAIWVKEGILLVRANRSTPKEAPEMHTLTAFRASDLQQLWQIRADSPELHEVGGVSVVSEIAEHDRGGKFMPIDLQTGQMAPPLPRRGPVESEWGGATWEVESIDSGNDFSQMRRNEPATGAAVWTLNIPFAVTGLLRDQDMLYLSGSTGADHFLAAIEWASGKPVKLFHALPAIRQLFRCDGFFVVWTFDGRILSF